jgi:hypothetical protein
VTSDVLAVAGAGENAETDAVKTKTTKVDKEHNIVVRIDQMGESMSKRALEC